MMECSYEHGGIYYCSRIRSHLDMIVKNQQGTQGIYSVHKNSQRMEFDLICGHFDMYRFRKQFSFCNTKE